MRSRDDVLRMDVLLWCATVAGLLAQVVFRVLMARNLSVASGSYGTDNLATALGFGLAVVVMASVGALVASRRRGNPIGWLFCAAALAFSVGDALMGYGTYASFVSTRLPAGSLALAVSDASWPVPITILGIFVPILYPTGHVPSPRWRAVLWAAPVTASLVVLSILLRQGPLETWPQVRNPLGVEWAAALSIALPALALVLFSSFVSVAVRFRRSRGEERLQMKWMLYAISVWAVAFLLSSLSLVVGVHATFLENAVLLGIVGVPVSAGVAILRYRLYEIDRIVNRTLVYGFLTASLAGVYLSSVVVLQAALQPVTRSSGIAVAASTLAVAAVFNPARRRVQAFVDRRFYRRRYDAIRTREAFALRLRDELGLATLDLELVGAVRQTMQPAAVTLWLR